MTAAATADAARAAQREPAAAAETAWLRAGADPDVRGLLDESVLRVFAIVDQVRSGRPAGLLWRPNRLGAADLGPPRALKPNSCSL